MLSSYDYLGLIGDPRIDGAAMEAIKKYGTGTGAPACLRERPLASTASSKPMDEFGKHAVLNSMSQHRAIRL